MHRNRHFLLPLSAIVLSFAAFSQTLPQGVQKVTSVEGITEYAYPTGCTSCCFPDPSKPKVTVNITYLVGSRHEGYGETGMAHLLEHMLFLRTKTGATLSKNSPITAPNWNGTTSFDRTNYFETLNATDENLAGPGAGGRPHGQQRIEKPLLDTEMTVVRNEFEMGENSPGPHAVPAHSRNRLHVPQLRQAAHRQPLRYRERADRAAGRVLSEVLPAGQRRADHRRQVRRGQGAGAGGRHSSAPFPSRTRKLEKTYTVEPTQDGERSITLRRVGDNQMLVAIYHMPAAPTPMIARAQRPRRRSWVILPRAASTRPWWTTRRPSVRRMGYRGYARPGLHHRHRPPRAGPVARRSTPDPAENRGRHGRVSRLRKKKWSAPRPAC